MPTLPRPTLSLKQLHYFAVLAETRHFTRAAELCFVTQSTLSAGLKELEESLGALLVERDRQTVLLTALGERLLPQARHMLAQASDVADIAKATRAPMAGELRLGAIPTIAPFVLPGLAARP